jgi:hypothetical protein
MASLPVVPSETAILPTTSAFLRGCSPLQPNRTKGEGQCLRESPARELQAAAVPLPGVESPFDTRSDGKPFAGFLIVDHVLARPE